MKHHTDLIHMPGKTFHQEYRDRLHQYFSRLSVYFHCFIWLNLFIVWKPSQDTINYDISSIQIFKHTVTCIHLWGEVRVGKKLHIRYVWSFISAVKRTGKERQRTRTLGFFGAGKIERGVSHTVILWRRSGGCRFSSVARSNATEIISKHVNIKLSTQHCVEKINAACKLWCLNDKNK